MDQWKRKASLLLVAGQKALDLSDMHFRFRVQQGDVPSPNNAEIRVYNLSAATVKTIRDEYSTVVLQAGYEASYGVIFKGTVKQWRIGRENATDSYLDILAADGDIFHNFSFVSATLDAGSSGATQLAALTNITGQAIDSSASRLRSFGGVLPRGRVLFGMSRDVLDAVARTHQATWSIQDGVVRVIDLDGYTPGEAVVLTSKTGLIGQPESTQEGVKLRCLLNPKLQPGRLVSVNNKSINQTLQTPGSANVPFNQRVGFQAFADTAADGLYRIYVIDHTGDTRGQAWYSELTGLTFNRTTQNVKPYG